MSANHARQSLPETIAYSFARWTGSSWVFTILLLLAALWLIAGFFMHFSDGWHHMMSDISELVSLLMVFLLQRTQNKDTLAMQLKLNEIIAVQSGANNRLINIETSSEEVIHSLHKEYEELASHVQQNEHVLKEALFLDEVVVTASENKI